MSGKPNAIELMARYKARGLSKYMAWDRYIADTGLRPEMDAKVFYELYENIGAAEHEMDTRLPDNWKPTHLDTALNQRVQVTQREGFNELVWEDGHKGSEPAGLFSVERYKERNQ